MLFYWPISYLLFFFLIQILGTVSVFSFSIALALKKTNFVSRNTSHFNKSALLPLCQPCIQFCLLHLKGYRLLGEIRRERLTQKSILSTRPRSHAHNNIWFRLSRLSSNRGVARIFSEGRTIFQIQ